MNKKTSQTQWDYPEEEDEEEADETGHTDRQHSMSSRLVSGKWYGLLLIGLVVVSDRKNSLL